MLRHPITPIFVFDGPERPGFKRGRYVGPHVNRLTKQFQAFVKAFGFYSYTVSVILAAFNLINSYFPQAPGEAEAKLAHLNRLGAIDAVMTEDSDIFVFGALVVFRK